MCKGDKKNSQQYTPSNFSYARMTTTKMADILPWGFARGNWNNNGTLIAASSVSKQVGVY